MEPLQFPGMQEASEHIRQAPHILVGVDYDGTLTPLVDDPARAVLPEATRQALWSLTQRQDVTLAVISGRAQADLQALVGIPELIYAGNHGMEISGPGISFIEPAAKAASGGLHDLAQQLGAKLRHIPGIQVEDKGLTLSVHYRRVAPVDGEEVWHIVHDAVNAMDNRFHVTLGEKVYEIRPHLRWNKGEAVKWLKTQLGQADALVVYLGDDATDEDAFHALGPNAVTIRIGDSAATAAQYLLPDPAAVQHFLQWLGELRTERERVPS